MTLSSIEYTATGFLVPREDDCGRKCLPVEKPNSLCELILELWSESNQEKLQLKWRAQVMAFICKMVPSEYLIGESEKTGNCLQSHFLNS